jgi:O-antigen/teichoic acid export membrane protein
MLTLRILGQGATLLATALLSRVLGPEDFGRYSFLFGFFLILSLFNIGGLNDIPHP